VTGVRSERMLLTALAGAQVTHILDFMLLMPLGAQLMRRFALTPGEFGLLVSIYMMTAAAVGFAAALVIDRFDRRSTLLVLYACFTATTLLTATAQTYDWLLAARATAGAFGGVLAATTLAIVADTVPEARRGAARSVSS
jgi:predicted MFS family arabinose efflux permease